MGRFLNRASNNNDFIKTTTQTYFVDKSNFINHFNNLIGRANQFVCITRPRRFGKSMNAQMLVSYYSCAMDTKDIFDRLNISKCPSYLEHLNKHNVIHISFNAASNDFSTYTEYITYFKSLLIADLKEFYPNIPDIYTLVYDIIDYIYQKTGQGFIFIIDEWDYIFDKQLFSLDDRKNFLDFLATLLKDRDYVDFAYMTGILPITRYSNSSSLNNFWEYAAIDDNTYGKYFGFLEEEVEELCKKQSALSMQDLQEWYNGYYTESEKRLYNPRSVVYALTKGKCTSFWANSTQKRELMPYITSDVAGVKSAILDMMSGKPFKIKLRGYDASLEALDNLNVVLSKMTTLGFFSYHNGLLRIPNRELMLEFMDTMQNAKIHGLSNIIASSNAMLDATIKQDAAKMAELIEEAHATYLTCFNYNDENSLASLITLMYITAHDYYNVSREDVAGIGRADFIFYPLDLKDTAFILELKVDDTPDNAIQQIMDKKYYVKLNKYTGKKLAIGISYYKDRDDKKHSVKIIEL